MSTESRRRRSLTLLGISLLLTACAGIEDQPLTTFDPQGPIARRLDDLFWMVFWIAVGVFVLVQGTIIVAMVVFRDRDGRREPKQLHGSPKLEVLWTIIPALILAGIAIPTTRAVFDLTECAPDAMTIEVIGHQWWFEFRYPDSGVETANELVIPAGAEVCAEMTSDDVIHNFWVPALNGKRYVIPGQVTYLRLEADEPGTFWGHCAEFCGLSHSLMRTRVVAVSPAEFESWVSAQLEPASLPAEGEPGHAGHQVFVNKGCAQCHQVRFDDESQSHLIARADFNGPDLTHFASRSTFAGSTLPEQGESRIDALKRWLADPPLVKPGSFMPDLALTEQEIDDLIAWLETNT